MNRIGRLRHVVRIEHLVTTTDPQTGFRSNSWQTVLDNEPAAMEPISGREFFAAEARQSEVTTRCTLRWRPEITPRMRVVHEENIYAIRAVLPDDTNRRWLTLMLERGTTDGA